MSFHDLCYTEVDGGGQCIFRIADTDELWLIPGDWIVEKAVTGGSSVCALRLGGSVECRRLSTDTWSVTMQHADAIDASIFHVFALEAGDIWCWGDEDLGECPGLGEAPRKITHVGDIITIAANEVGHVCGIRRDGSVLCWGGPSPSMHLQAYGGWRHEDQAVVDRPRAIENVGQLTWLRPAGYAAFCGGTDTPTTTIECWGVGEAPVIELPHAAAVWAEPWTFFRARSIRLDGRVADLAGSKEIGCYLDSTGTRTCRTTNEELHASCAATLISGSE